MSNVPGRADHAAAPADGGGLWSSLPFRTVVQGVATDAAVAVGFVVYDALDEGDVDWRWLGVTVGKTVLMTVASWAMRRFKPAAA